MTTGLIYDLATNLGILALCAIMVTFVAEFSKVYASASNQMIKNDRDIGFGLWIGLIFGITCAALIMSSYHSQNGSVIDTRAAPAILSGIVGGPVAAIVTFILGAAARLVVGGDFVIGGTASVAIYAGSGFFLGRMFNVGFSRNRSFSYLKMATIGILSTVLVSPSFFMDQELSRSLHAAQMVMPVLMIHNPISVLLLGIVLRNTLGTIFDRNLLTKTLQTLERQTEKAESAQIRMSAAIEALPEAFVLYDAQDRAVMFNTKYRDIYKASAKAIEIGVKFEDILREGLRNGQYPEAIGREEAWLAERLERHRNPEGPIDQELPGERHLQIHEARLPNGDTVGFRVDVTELKLQKQELLKRANALDIAATTDPLTGLQNRRGLERCMAELATKTEEQSKFGLLHVDLDRFKPINDVFGHAAGDHLLRRVGAILTASVRANDHVARVGGDEFVVLLNAPCDEDEAKQVADRIISASTAPVKWQDKTLHFGASVGIALGSGDTLRNMLHDADIALYEAKKAGRNRHHLFSARLRHEVETRKALSDELIHGLGRGEIVAFFQPQISAFDGALVGVEALARWNHPNRGILLPAQFLPIAEDLGVTCEIDRLVCDHAVEIGRRLVSAGSNLAQISVNAGLKQLTQSANLDWLPDPAQLPFKFCLEILEAVDVDRDFDEISWVFDGLRERGVQIEVDDFGSGRASLTALLKIRPDRIKLDIEIVRAALFDPMGAGSMVRAIAEMCRGLGIPMTAEGIESRKHAELMRDMGCDILQGYHYARPMDHETLIKWVADKDTSQKNG